jgi:hypothetical protein
LRPGRLPPREARPEQDGKVADLVRHLVDEQSNCGDDSHLERDQETSADCQTVHEIVHAVVEQIEVAEHLYWLHKYDFEC